VVLVGYVVGVAFFADGHIEFVPPLLRWAVGVFGERRLGFEFHYDGLFVAFLALIFKILGPDAFDSWKFGRELVCAVDGGFDLFGGRVGFPLHINNVENGGWGLG
jgi:hypothetical protein